MKKPASKMSHGTKEKPKGGKTGVNKPVVKAAVPQKVAENRYGNPTQKQRL